MSLQDEVMQLLNFC